MSVRKREWKSPKGEPRVAWAAYWYDADGKYRSAQFDRRRDAVAHERKVRRELDDGVHVPDSESATINAVVPLLLARKRDEGLEDDSIKVVETRIRIHIKDAECPKDIPNGWDGKLGELKLTKLTAPIADAFALLLVRTLSRYLARRVLLVFKEIVREAIRRGLLKLNAAADIKIARRKRAEPPLRIGVSIPNKREVRAILAAVSPDREVGNRGNYGAESKPFRRHRWVTLFMIAAFAGLRASELRALIWRNVDLIAGVIHVTQRADRHGKIGPPKTHAGYREVPISREVVAQLRCWKRVCPTPQPDGLVFQTYFTWNVIGHSVILDKVWYPTLRKLGMVDADDNTRYGFHSLRHFFASLMIEAGVLPNRLQELMGHASVQVTLTLYAHLFPRSALETAKMNGAVSAVLAGRDDDDKNALLDDIDD